MELLSKINSQTQITIDMKNILFMSDINIGQKIKGECTLEEFQDKKTVRKEHCFFNV